MLLDLEAGMTTCSHAKNVVEFFECPLLRLWKEEEYEEEGDHIHASVEAESTSGAESRKNGGKRNRKDRRPEIYDISLVDALGL